MILPSLHCAFLTLTMIFGHFRNNKSDCLPMSRNNISIKFKKFSLFLKNINWNNAKEPLVLPVTIEKRRISDFRSLHSFHPNFILLCSKTSMTLKEILELCLSIKARKEPSHYSIEIDLFTGLCSGYLH